jgi:hypothetical protein
MEEKIEVKTVCPTSPDILIELAVLNKEGGTLIAFQPLSKTIRLIRYFGEPLKVCEHLLHESDVYLDDSVAELKGRPWG